MRITSRLYISLGLVYGFFIVTLFIAFLQERQPPFMYFVLTAIEATLGFFLWGTWNCMDIYLDEDRRVELRFHGTVINIAKTIKLRKLPFIAKVGGQQLSIVYIRFLDDLDNRKLKFFIIPTEAWPLIEPLREEKSKP